MGKLIITEPWDLSVGNLGEAKILRKNDDDYLIQLSKPIQINGLNFYLLIGRIRGGIPKPDLLKENNNGNYVINLVYYRELTIDNFEEFKFDDFRGTFLQGDFTN